MRTNADAIDKAPGFVVYDSDQIGLAYLPKYCENCGRITMRLEYTTGRYCQRCKHKIEEDIRQEQMLRAHV